MDQRQRIAVAGNFLFRSVPRHRLVVNDLLHLDSRSLDALDAVGGFRGLDASGFPQCRKGLWGLLPKKLLFAPVGADGMDRCEIGGFETKPFDQGGIEGRHAEMG